MGRGKIEIKKIENTSARHVSFSKRRQGLFKKARELSILCDADVAIIIYSSSGRVYEYSSSDMTNILTRFNKCVESKQSPAVEHNAENQLQESNDADVLKQEIEKLKSKQRQLLGKDLTDMDLQELHELDKQLHEGLMCVTKRKELMLTQQIEQSKTRKQQMMQENEILQRQVEEIQRFIQPINYLAPLSIDYAPETTFNVGPADYKDSDTILLLGSARHLEWHPAHIVEGINKNRSRM
ncbi:agamous-like mads-box protein agl15 [Phtheirospermum japonicum]|uniref:Agamous-like mads-box protein agl15 n=1 Tax=Phtheirospermum japonicum TaxID=374723 RepID=A0A830BZW7_9LAMI|nr:agamous-like mads-box protein agl15 [Phtheirospermum japonicum]